MNTNLFNLFLLAGAVGFCSQRAAGADIGFQGPSLGYYVDQNTHSLHALSGVPGAATVGPALVTGFEEIWPGPNSRIALGLRQGMIFFLKDLRDTTLYVPVMSWSGAIESVEWAGDSNGVLIYSAERGTYRTVTGLQQSPTVNPEVNLRRLGSFLISLRLSTSPWTVAAVVAGRSPSSLRNSTGVTPVSAPALYFLHQDGTSARAAKISQPGAMDFSADGRSLYVADRAINQLMRIAVDAPDSAETMTLPSAFLNPSDFTNLAASPDGLRLFVLQQEARQACAVELNSMSLGFCSDLDFAPSGMLAISDALYLLNPLGLNPVEDRITPLWVLDSKVNGTFFIPRGGQW